MILHSSCHFVIDNLSVIFLQASLQDVSKDLISGITYSPCTQKRR